MLRDERIPNRLSIGGNPVPDSDLDSALALIKKIYGEDVFRSGSQSATNRRIDMRCGHLPKELADFRASINSLRLAV